jgi:anti-sigma B factor antagonist
MGVTAIMKVETHCGVTVIITEERLDSLVGPKLKDVVNDLTRSEGVHLVIDMQKTLFIDSSGLGGLLSSLKSVIKKQGDIRIARPTPQALTLLRLTRLHRVFEIHDTLEDAIKPSCS